MLRIDHLTKTYGEKKAVDDLTLRIRPGEICGFIGHNGAGKTTTLGVMFGFAASMLCEPLLGVGMGWLYWCLMGLIAIFFGVFGSVFNTYASLYQAKDNDLLLAMPVPVRQILLARLLGVYAMGLLYELLVMIPTLILWFLHAPFSAVGTVCTLLIPLVLSVLILILSAVLGWVVARCSRRNCAGSWAAPIICSTVAWAS